MIYTCCIDVGPSSSTATTTSHLLFNDVLDCVCVLQQHKKPQQLYVLIVTPVENRRILLQQSVIVHMVLALASLV